jgi:hypothetical protein
MLSVHRMRAVFPQLVVRIGEEHKGDFDQSGGSAVAAYLNS